jgi:two-component system, OmpR family, sensor histidine kinase BaeS
VRYVARLVGPSRTLQRWLVATYAAVALLAVALSAVVISVTLWLIVLDRLGVDLAGEAYLIADQVWQPLQTGDTAAVAEYVQRIAPLTTGHILVVDRTGAVVAAGDPEALAALQEDAALGTALSGESTVTTSGRFGRHSTVIHVVVPVRAPSGDIVGAVRETYNFNDLQAVFIRIILAAMFGALGAAGLAGLVGLYYAREIARPVRRVARAALAVADRRHLDPLALPAGSPEEVRSLGRAFNSMVTQLATHEQARREFASDISHELHALASAMQTAADALERGSTAHNPASTQRLVTGLVGHTRRLNRLSMDLLELARWEGGRMRIDFEDLDVADLVHGILDEWAAEVERRDTVLQVEMPDRAMPLRGDPVRLAQALGNLIENGLKYASAGGRIRIAVLVDATQRRYSIGVEDSGPGISHDDLPRIFERYYRVEGRTGSGAGGMGLGLAIARAIARAHEGDVIAESVPGAGARFVLQLPVPSAESRERSDLAVAPA